MIRLSRNTLAWLLVVVLLGCAAVIFWLGFKMSKPHPVFVENPVVQQRIDNLKDQK